MKIQSGAKPQATNPRRQGTNPAPAVSSRDARRAAKKQPPPPRKPFGLRLRKWESFVLFQFGHSPGILWPFARDFYCRQLSVVVGNVYAMYVARATKIMPVKALDSVLMTKTRRWCLLIAKHQPPKIFKKYMLQNKQQKRMKHNVSNHNSEEPPTTHYRVEKRWEQGIAMPAWSFAQRLEDGCSAYMGGFECKPPELVKKPTASILSFLQNCKMTSNLRLKL